MRALEQIRYQELIWALQQPQQRRFQRQIRVQRPQANQRAQTQHADPLRRVRDSRISALRHVQAHLAQNRQTSILNQLTHALD
jgi:hypothetical protein